jgi:uncharacterized membrane protein YraQ (UPF0718 family)
MIALVALIASLVKDINKTKMGIKKGFKAFKNIIPLLVPLFLIVGILLTFVTPELIKSVLGENSGVFGIISGLLLGSVAFMPPFVTFPLASDLLSQGAGYPQIGAFVTTLMGVGVVYIQTESKFFGTSAMVKRNALAFVAASIVAVVMGVFM